MIGWIVEKISSCGWRMKWRRLRPVTTRGVGQRRAQLCRRGTWSRSSLRAGAARLAARRRRGRRAAARAGRPPSSLGGRARELQEHVVERGPAQPEVAHPDPGLAQRRGGVLDQLEAVARGGHA